MPDGNYNYDETVIFDSTDDAIVSNSIAPKARQFATERVPQGLWIDGRGHATIEILHSLPLDSLVKFCEVALRPFVELNRPSQGFSSLHRN